MLSGMRRMVLNFRLEAMPSIRVGVSPYLSNMLIKVRDELFAQLDAAWVKLNERV